MSESNCLRSVNWLSQAANSVQAVFPELHPHGGYLIERLSCLLLERLPLDISLEILELLPQNEGVPSLTNSLSAMGNRSIGYIDFVEKTKLTLGVIPFEKENPCLKPDDELLRFSEKIADTFLWSIAQEFDPELKSRLLNILPSELSYRMNLKSASAEDAKVA